MISHVDNDDRKVWWKRRWVLILGGIILIGAVFGNSADDDGEPTESAPTTTSTVVQTTTSYVPATTAVPVTTAPPTATSSPATTVSPTPTQPATTTTAPNADWNTAFVKHLEVNDSSPSSDYNRDDWGSGWVDADGDCLSTRHEVLLSESLVDTTMDSSGCKVIGGQWFAVFTGTYVDDPSSLDIDHFVPLANAHASGGWAWSADTKRDFYNDLTDPQRLIAVTASANRSKGARGPDEWKPSDETYWCQYAYTWTDIKTRWQLTATSAEFTALEVMLATCDSMPKTNDATSLTLPIVATTVPNAMPPTTGSMANSTEAPEWLLKYEPGWIEDIDRWISRELCPNLNSVLNDLHAIAESLQSATAVDALAAESPHTLSILSSSGNHELEIGYVDDLIGYIYDGVESSTWVGDREFMTGNRSAYECDDQFEWVLRRDTWLASQSPPDSPT